MAQTQHTPAPPSLEEAITTLFCEIDDAYRILNPRADLYEAIKKLSDSEVLTLALFQQLRGVESERSFLRDAQRFFVHLFPGVAGLAPSSFHRRLRKLRRFVEPLRRSILAELVGDPETLVVDSTLLEVLHPRQVSQSAGFDGAAWVRWGSFSVYGVKLHMLCATNRVPVSYELTAANVADVHLVVELLGECGLGEDLARRLLGDLAYQSEELERTLAGAGLFGHRTFQPRWQAPAGGDRFFEPQERLRDRTHACQDASWVGHQDRDKDNGLHLRLCSQPAFGKATRPDEGFVGMKTLQHSSSRVMNGSRMGYLLGLSPGWHGQT